MTVAYDPVELRERIYDTTAILLAAGLDPARCILFRQSDVREHTELTWLLSSVTELGRLERMHQFRDKSDAQRELVRAGLLFYPVLMAADVLAYRAHEVPVGEDQREHVELMRDVADSFNGRFAAGEEVLVVPELRIPEVGARIMDLQEPSRKMSTTGGSEQGTVYVLDEPKAIEKKVKSAVTDSGSEVRRGEGKEGDRQPDRNPRRGPRRASPTRSRSRVRRCATATSRRRRRSGRRLPRAGARALRRAARGRAGLEAILGRGAEQARAIARATLADVRELMGVGAPSRVATRV